MASGCRGVATLALGWLTLLFGVISSVGAIGVTPAPGDVPVNPQLRPLLVQQFSCEKDQPFNDCVRDGVKSLVETAGTGISFALASGQLPETSLGALKISGENIELSGVETLSAADAVVQADTLFTTLTLDTLQLEGDFTIRIPILGAIKVHINMHVEKLRSPVAIVLAVRDGKLVISDFRVEMDFERFDIEINRGGPLLPGGGPLGGIINGVARSFLKGLTQKEMLKKVLPLMIDMLKPGMLKLINSLLQGGATGL